MADTQHTKDKLADALRAVGLDDMAVLAADGYYHDYLSPLVMPEITLINDLGVEAGRRPAQRDAILTLREAVMNGEHDASKEESDDGF